MPTHTLLLALDACDAVLAQRLAATGQMPALARLLADGMVADTIAPAGFFVSANWPTIFTALAADRHHYTCWDGVAPGTYTYGETTPRQIAGTPFWETLSDAGRRVAVLDVPHSRVCRPLDGIIVTEWGCHDRHFGTASHPADLAATLSARFGAHPIGTAPERRNGQFAPCDFLHRDDLHRTAAEDAALYADLVTGLACKQVASTALLRESRWDLFLNVHSEAHCAGHQFWHHHDRTHPAHDPARAAALGDPVVDIYRQLDASIAAHLDAAGPDALVYLLLSHGMGPHYDGTLLLDPVLRALEATVDGVARGWRGRLAQAALAPLPGALRRLAGRAAAPFIRRRLSAPPLVRRGWDLSDIAERRWFSAPNNTVAGAVRLNLAGREPAGRVTPDEVDGVLGWLADRLRELVNVDTGRPAVRRVTRTDVAYPRRGDDLPDLLVEWDDSAPLARVWSPTIGVVEGAADHWRSGDHRRHGLLVARGHGITPGRQPDRMPVVDIAPTIAAALGVRLPGVDGQPVAALVPNTARAVIARRSSTVPWHRSGASDPAPHRLAAAQAQLARTDAALAAATAETAQLRATHAAESAALRAQVETLAERTATLERHAQIATTEAWVAALPVTPGPLVSVIIPTRDRASWLAQAVASVQAQSYAHWECLVIDDDSRDDTASWLAALDDPRVRRIPSDGHGCAAARNTGLAHARGDVIAYLDDDNRFAPQWLKTVAWAFGSHADTQAVYGARIADDVDRFFQRGAGGLPYLQLLPWDRAALESFNRIDMNVLAHRRRDDVRFDPSLDYFADWDLVLALTAERAPLMLPVVAAHYTTDAPDRLSHEYPSPRLARQEAYVREKHRADAPRPLVRAPRPQRKVLCTVGAGAHAELLHLARPTFARYAQRHGYELVEGTVDHAHGRPAAWAKVRLLRELAPHHDLLLWIDADTLVVDSSRDIADELRTDRLLHVVEHRYEGWRVPNAGVMAIRGGDEACELLDRWWTMDDYTHHRWWDNAALLVLLGYTLFPVVPAVHTPWRTRTAFLDRRWNSIAQDPSPAPAIVHYAGIAHATRLAQMQATVAGTGLSTEDAPGTKIDWQRTHEYP